MASLASIRDTAENRFIWQQVRGSASETNHGAVWIGLEKNTTSEFSVMWITLETRQHATNVGLMQFVCRNHFCEIVYWFFSEEKLMLMDFGLKLV